MPPITKTIQARRTRHAGHCWRSKDEFISDILLWTSAYGQAKVGRPARTYIQQLCEDTGCSPEDMPEAMNDWEKWRKRVRDIRASGTTWWWWWWYYVNRPIRPVGRVFANGPRDRGSIPGRLKKWYFTLIIRYVSRVNWSNPAERVAPPLHLGVVAIEKGAFGSPPTTVASFTFLRYEKEKWEVI